jgi:hypothetical protein
VDHPVKGVVGKAVVHDAPVGKIAKDEMIAGIGASACLGKQPQPRLLDRRIVVLVDAVDTDNLVAALEEPPGDMIAYEAGDAGDQNLHQKRPSSGMDP